MYMHAHPSCVCICVCVCVRERDCVCVCPVCVCIRSWNEGHVNVCPLVWCVCCDGCGLRWQAAKVIGAREALLAELGTRCEASGKGRPEYLGKLLAAERAILDGDDPQLLWNQVCVHVPCVEVYVLCECVCV